MQGPPQASLLRKIHAQARSRSSLADSFVVRVRCLVDAFNVWLRNSGPD